MPGAVVDRLETIEIDVAERMRLTVLANTSWRRNSGSALLVARDFIKRSDGAFLVIRGDRPLDRESLMGLLSSQVSGTNAMITVAQAPVTGLNLDAGNGRARCARVADERMFDHQKSRPRQIDDSGWYRLSGESPKHPRTCPPRLPIASLRPPIFGMSFAGGFALACKQHDRRE